MASSAVYTNVFEVAKALSIQSPEKLNSNADVGNTIITLNHAAPNDWVTGSQLLLDSNSATLQETVTISAVAGSQITVTAITKPHNVGCPVINVTLLSGYPAIASRYIDRYTNMSEGYALEEVTETKDAIFSNDGSVTIVLSKPVVTNVISCSIVIPPNMSNVQLDVGKTWIEEQFFLKSIYHVSGVRYAQAQVRYFGGYQTLPDDIVWATTVLAARFYKERDSGYSDTIGNIEMGVIQYKRSLPADIAEVLNSLRRCVS